MARASLRRFDVQAKWAVLFSTASVLCCLAFAFLLLRNWKGDVQQIIFRGDSMYQPVVVVCAGLSMLLALFGATLGFNSAGQRRNDKQKLSWTGFFVGAGVLSVSLVLFTAFYLFRFGL